MMFRRLPFLSRKRHFSSLLFLFCCLITLSLCLLTALRVVVELSPKTTLKAEANDNQHYPYPHHLEQQRQQRIPSISTTKDNNNNNKPEIQIAVWAGPKFLKRFRGTLKGINQEKCFQGCKVFFGNDDEASKDDKAEKADAILFVNPTTGFKKEELPKRRRDWSQIWIYMQLEPPLVYSPDEHFNDKFNWTMTYRLDSDIPNPYFKTVIAATNKKKKLIKIEGKGLKEWINGKTDMGVAIISNCDAKSRRLEILQTLKDIGLQIDIYGKCGITKGICGRSDKNCKSDFFQRMPSKYKFYFSFESSLCSDYITEKFENPLRWGLVPVVLGNGDYKKVAPPGSFIDIRDFPDPRKLVEFLKRLDKDEEEYGKYFEWRKTHSIYGGGGNNLCEICRRMKIYKKELQQQSQFGETPPQFSKHYPNLVEWWNNGSTCLSPEAMGLQNYLINKSF